MQFLSEQPELRYICDPLLVRFIRMKISIQQILFCFL